MIELGEVLLRADPPVRVFVACTGAGAGIQNALWQVPGASAYLVGGVFPYSTHETDRFLGFKPDSYCSRTTAIELAMAAYMRACESSSAGDRPVGLGVTAVVSSNREHKGDHRVFAAVVTDAGAWELGSVIPKRAHHEARRADDVDVVCHAEAVLSDALGLGLGFSDHPSTAVPEEELRKIFFTWPLFLPSGKRRSLGNITPTQTVFLPGTFDPVHMGHRGMAKAAARLTRRVIFSVTATPPHKEALSVPLMLRRAAQFKVACDHEILFTEGEPLYIDKARHFPGAYFAIGVDAALRMFDPKWGHEIEPLLAEFRELGTRFLVFGRDGVPASSVGDHGVFLPMGGAWDVSSTALREAAARAT